MQGVFGITLVELFGLEKLTAAYGLSYFFQGKFMKFCYVTKTMKNEKKVLHNISAFSPLQVLEQQLGQS